MARALVYNTAPEVAPTIDTRILLVQHNTKRATAGSPTGMLAAGSCRQRPPPHSLAQQATPPAHVSAKVGGVVINRAKQSGHPSPCRHTGHMRANV